MAKFDTITRTAKEFIEHDNSICYCEVLIFPNGTVQYAVPSHRDAALTAYMLMTGKNELNDIPITAAPALYACDEISVCLISYYSVVVPINHSYEQLSTIIALMKAGKLSKDADISLNGEKHIVDMEEEYTNSKDYSGDDFAKSREIFFGILKEKEKSVQSIIHRFTE